MYYQMKGVYLPFFYVIFGKSGWSKFVLVEASKEKIEEHQNKIKRFKKDLKNFKPSGVDNYSICRKCPIICDKRVLKPNLIQILY